MKLRSHLSLVLFLVVALSCSDRKVEPAVDIPGPQYFPLQTGSFITYSVDSTKIIQNVETVYNFELRISITSSFVNAEGNTTYVLQREKRADKTQPWKTAGTWTAWKSIQQAVVSEGNTSYIKLQFPLSNGKGWNGNALNSVGGEDLCNDNKCDRYDVTEMDGSLAVVTQEDRDDVVMTDQRVERYSKNVGLVYKEITTLEYCTGSPCPIGTDYIVNGLKYKQEMIDSGKL